MRSLATDRYTAAEVETQLRASTAAYTSRFELLDTANGTVGDISESVVSATRTWDGTRPIKGSLQLAMIPDDDLADALFRYRVKPWFGLQMPDGGVAEYPQGVYLWSSPSRDLDGVSAEMWDLTLGDLGHTLDLQGPGLTAFKVTRGSLLTDGIRRVLEAAGFADFSRLVPSTVVSADDLSFSMSRNMVGRGTGGGRHFSFGGGLSQWRANAPTAPDNAADGGPQYSTNVETWMSIIGALSDGLGYDDLWFDAVGLPVVAPAADLSTAAAQVTYDTGADAVLLPPVGLEPDLSQIANRVYARSKSRRPAGQTQGTSGDDTTSAPLAVGVADANDLLPGHPLSEAVIGFYVDQVVTNDVTVGQEQLDAQARRNLYWRITSYETVDLSTLAWPVHDGYEQVAVRFAGDRQLDTPGLFLEDQHSLVIRADGKGTGTMKHRLRRITAATT